MEETVIPRQEGGPRESCQLGEDTYPETTQVCTQEVCMICQDGKWIELDSEPEE